MAHGEACPRSSRLTGSAVPAGWNAAGDDRGLAVGQAGRITTWQVCVRFRVLHADDDFPSGVTCFQVPDRLRSLVQGVGPVDDRCDLSGFDEFLQHG
jgi:hypothetical protein